MYQWSLQIYKCGIKLVLDHIVVSIIIAIVMMTVAWSLDNLFMLLYQIHATVPDYKLMDTGEKVIIKDGKLCSWRWNYVDWFWLTMSTTSERNFSFNIWQPRIYICRPHHYRAFIRICLRHDCIKLPPRWTTFNLSLCIREVGLSGSFFKILSDWAINVSDLLQWTFSVCIILWTIHNEI